MYMNMTIVMNMNIYIRPDLEQRLRQEDSMSGLINKLLDDYFQDPPTPYKKSIVEDSSLENIFSKKQNVFKPKSVISEVAKDFDFCKNGHPMKGDKCFGKGCKYN